MSERRRTEMMIALVLIGCSDQTRDDNCHADAPVDAGNAGTESAKPLPGSYDIVGEVAGVPSGGCYVGEWTKGTSFRLDISGDTPGIDAIVWASNAVQTGTTRFDPTVPFSEATDCHKGPTGPFTLTTQEGSWAFALDSCGAPTAALASSGGRSWCTQPTGGTVQFFGGKAGPDTTPAGFEIQSFRPGLALPWEDLDLWASEGLDQAAWLQKSSATMDGVAIATDPMPVPGTVKTNQLRLALPVSEWSTRSGKTLHVEVAGGVTDGSGNSSASFSSDVTFADVGPVSTAILFDGSGAPALLGFTAKPAGDPTCEAGQACATGIWEPDAPPIAVAGRVDMGSAASLQIRRKKLNLGAMGIGLIMSVRVISDSGAVYERDVYLTDLSTSEEWVTDTVPVPAGLGVVGVIVQPSTANDCFTRIGFTVTLGSITPA